MMSKNPMRHMPGMEEFLDYKYLLPKTFKLNNGYRMPAMGLGTYNVKHYDVVLKTLDEALKAGYRLFDTATLYGNEVYINFALKKLLPKYGLQRKDIFIITKLSPCDYGGGHKTETAFYKSLNSLGVDYIDLYLVHYPGNARVEAEANSPVAIPNHTWATLANMYFDRKIKALGVSNYHVSHLTDLMKHKYGVTPAVNQVEWHPYYNHANLRDYCKKNNIVMQAYSPLGGSSSEVLLDDPIVLKVAENVDATPAQVLLVWSLQQNIAVIPKTVDPDRLRENIDLRFTIPWEDMKELNALHLHNTKFSWDPTFEY